MFHLGLTTHRGRRLLPSVPTHRLEQCHPVLPFPTPAPIHNLLSPSVTSWKVPKGSSQFDLSRLFLICILLFFFFGFSH